VARLVDRGLLSWSTPLDQMLPELSATMRPEFRTVTLGQLLSHHAGLAHDTTDLKFFGTFFRDPRPLPVQRLDYVAQMLKESPESRPGTKFNYSNTGFLIAAVIAERAGGAPYETLMQREIFQPLGMKGVSFGPIHDGQPQGHINGRPARLEDANPLMFAPAGNMSMSLRDWSAFCLDQMAGVHGHGKLLALASYRLMQTAQPGGGSAGLGWGIQASLAGHKGPVLLHAGSDGTGFALVALFPELESGILTASNGAQDLGGDKATQAAMMALLAQFP
jgi:CubicO group peptidase (beta-lactamase class C family)